MKLPDFEYAAPSTAGEVVDLLAAHGANAKVISGGQSLLPAMAFRLARPSMLIDLCKVEGLDRISIDGSGVRLGARVRWRDIEDADELKRAHPLLVEAIAHVAHYQIRNRGTVGGSLAHADPASEMPCIAVTCEAELSLLGPRGERGVKAADFFLGALTTALAEDEIITGIQLPSWPRARRWAFLEVAKRRGDFALAGVALFYDLDTEQRAHNAHIGVLGACHFPQRLLNAERALNGRMVDEDAARAAARAASDEADPGSDLHASARYRKALLETLVERALGEAANRQQTSATL